MYKEDTQIFRKKQARKTYFLLVLRSEYRQNPKKSVLLY